MKGTKMLDDTEERGVGDGKDRSDNLVIRIHNIIVMIMWTGLAAWEFEYPSHRAGEGGTGDGMDRGLQRRNYGN